MGVGEIAVTDVPVSPIAVVSVVAGMAIGAPAGNPAFLISRIGREVAGAGLGPPLIEIVVLLDRIGQPLKGRPSAASATAPIDRNVTLHARAGVTEPACHR